MLVNKIIEKKNQISMKVKFNYRNSLRIKETLKMKFSSIRNLW